MSGKFTVSRAQARDLKRISERMDRKGGGVPLEVIRRDMLRDMAVERLARDAEPDARVVARDVGLLDAQVQSDFVLLQTLTPGSPAWQNALSQVKTLIGAEVKPLTSVETASAALALARQHLDPAPVVAVIFTHSHIDHFAGVRGVLPEDPTARAQIRIVAPRGFVEEATSENILAGVAMGRRAQYMYGLGLARSARGHIDTGLGKQPAAGSQHPRYLAKCATVVRDVLDDVQGRHDVEAVVGERQRLGVGLAEADGKSIGRGALARALEQRRHVVGGDHVAPATRGREGDVAVARGNVEHLLS
jgi:hypothetical protein